MSVTARRMADRPNERGSGATVRALYPALALLLSIFAIAPLAYPGFFQSYTGYRAVYNLIELHSRPELAWSADWSRAYDLLRMDGPLGYWLAELFHLLGGSFMDAVKLGYALGFLVGAYGMYRLARHVFASQAAGLLAAALYTYFPAHLATVYVRGAFGEALAWGLFPLALAALVAVEGKPNARLRDAGWCALAYAALLLAQPGLAILMAIFSRVWLLVVGPRPAQKRGFFRSPAVNGMLAGLALGILLLLPSILRQPGLTSPNGFVPAFVLPFQLLSASWGSALPSTDVPLLSATAPAANQVNTAAAAGQAPYQIGLAVLGLTVLAVALAWRADAPSEATQRTRRVLWFGVGTTLVVALLLLPWAAPLWDWSGLNLLMQYPIQLLVFVGLALSVAAASAVVSDVRLGEIPLLAALVIVPLLAVYAYLSPEFLDFAPTKPALAQFNNDVALLDAKIVRPPGVWRHGATVELNLTWQALRQPNRDYTEFLHILDADGKEWGATDAKPQGEALSTLNWVPGRVYSDTQRVQISLDGPAEGYHMELGLYQAATGERAVTETGATEIQIEELPTP